MTVGAESGSMRDGTQQFIVLCEREGGVGAAGYSPAFKAFYVGTPRRPSAYALPTFDGILKIATITDTQWFSRLQGTSHMLTEAQMYEWLK